MLRSEDSVEEKKNYLNSHRVCDIYSFLLSPREWGLSLTTADGDKNIIRRICLKIQYKTIVLSACEAMEVCPRHNLSMIIGTISETRDIPR